MIQSPAFTDPNTHPLILYLICEKFLDKDWKTWITDTIVQEISTKFSVEIIALNINKLMAAKTLYISDTFWDEWEIYKNIVLALNDQPLSLQTIVAPNTAYIMNAVEIANSVRKQDFDQEIARFTAACLMYDDVHYAPPPLDFCQLYISQPIYMCKDCGTTASALKPFEGQCEFCSEMYKSPKPFNFKPKTDKGYNVTYSLTFDPIPVKKKFDELSKQKDPFINEIPEEIQAGKLIIARNYTSLKLDEFHSQLKKYGVG